MFTKVEHQSNGFDLIKINNDETTIVFTNYGARIVSWKYNDNNIVLGNVVEADEFYLDNPFNFGATVGRYGGRIENATFELEGQTYQLEANDDPHHIHGGSNGLDTTFFDYEIVEQVNQTKLIFTTELSEAQDGYPGDIRIQVTHTYDINYCWTVEYEATSTKTTLFNPMNHVYFNLNRDNNVVDNHVLSSEELLLYPLNKQHLVDTEEPIDLVETFGKDKITLTELFESDVPQLAEQMAQCGGLDHPIEVSQGQLQLCNNQFVLDVETDMPYVVMFTFNDPSSWDSDFNIYKAHSGVTLETQCMPNDINRYGEDACSVLEPHQPFYSKTTYKISVKNENE
ncbi:aldose epimerase family protein [Staphylococcus auricularis]|uniref:aldose epimerase family protein n=1 Tax=Staphylococcus auricularis TaxID=29379 RepID=UPI003EBA7CC0